MTESIHPGSHTGVIIMSKQLTIGITYKSQPAGLINLDQPCSPATQQLIINKLQSDPDLFSFSTVQLSKQNKPYCHLLYQGSAIGFINSKSSLEDAVELIHDQLSKCSFTKYIPKSNQTLASMFK